MQSPPKPPFARWLIEQVETGQYTGLRYEGQNRFRVPWKHNSRKDCGDDDCKIFRAWAVASGKIHEFPNNKARWKTNFRCAMNNIDKRFKMIMDNSKNSDDPHKIFEIIDAEYNYESPPTQDSPGDAYMRPDICSFPIEDFPIEDELILLDNLMALDLGNQTSENMVEDFRRYPVAAEHHLQPAPDQPSYCEVNPPPVLSSPPQQPSIFDLEVSIHYRKREMLKVTLSTALLQLHYQHESPELDGHRIRFPSADGLLDQKQVEFTNRILNSIQRGLFLEVQDTGIYAWRQDRCHVFASTSDPSVAHPEPSKLLQNTRVELLSFEKYVNELKQFRDNNGGSPEYTINMCFGEKFPDGKPLEKKLIVVKVVPLICRHYHEIAQMEGASSLHSSNVSLQISHNSLYDLISSVFGLPTEEESARPAAPLLPQS
ncbi:interferon regulatory factor 7-like [Gasterosteus aculeatus]